MVAASTPVTGTDLVPAPVFQNLIASGISNLPAISDTITETPAVRQEIDTRKQNLRNTKTSEIMVWGNSNSAPLTSVSIQMIGSVKNKDLTNDPIADGLNSMVLSIRSFNVSDLNGSEKKGGLMSWLKKTVSPLAQAVQRYESVESQLQSVISKLDNEISILMKDVFSFDDMYKETLSSFHSLKIDIKAAEEVLAEMEGTEIPRLQSLIVADDPETSLAVNEAIDRARKIERNIASLKQTKTVTLQFLPTIHTLQDQDTGAIEKAQIGISKTIPLWRQQIALLLGTQRLNNAAKVLSSVDDLTADLIRNGAAQISQVTQETAKILERDTIDVAAIQDANNSFVDMLNGITNTYVEARKKRLEGATILDTCERDLRKALENSVTVMASTTAALPSK